MSIVQEVRDRGGVARTTHIARLGYSPHAIKKALGTGTLFRPRYGWLALRSADPDLLFAAKHGVVLSCVTQAKRLGLWVLEEDVKHVAMPKRGHKAQLGDGVVHWRRPPRIRAPGALIDPIENVLDYVAYCQPHDAALAIWDSALQKGLIDYLSLKSLPFGPRAKLLLEEASPFADSGLETFFRTRLSWLKIPIRAQTSLYGHRVDFLIGDRLIVQIDGKQHSGAQRTKDMQYDAELSLRGYHVIRVNYALVVHDWPAVQEIILDSVSRGLHLAR